MKKTAFTVACLTISVFLFADGLQLENGRFKGEVTVLRLTEAQEADLEETRDMALTLEQRKKLEANAGVAPSRLFIYLTKDGENDCTCFAWNLGLLFQSGTIEVPHHYLVSDQRAKELQAELDSLEGGQ